MKKIVILLLIGVSTSVFSQQQNETKFWDNVRFGGGFGLGFGNNSTTIAISPTAVYDFSEQFSLGLGVGYQYAHRGEYRSNIFSGSVLSLYSPFNNFQVSAEFEQLFVNQKYINQKHGYNYPALYLGASYKLGRNVSMGVRYDVLYDKTKSIYSSPISPIIRVFF